MPSTPSRKFIYTNPGKSPEPKRPARHPSLSSTRSRSLELLDQPEKIIKRLTDKSEPSARPRSRSLDDFLDDNQSPVPVPESLQEPSDEKAKVEPSPVTPTLPVPRPRTKSIKLEVNKLSNKFDYPTRQLSLDCEITKSKVTDCCDIKGHGDKDIDIKNNNNNSNNDKCTLAKSKSCGAGLDESESISSNEFKDNVVQGSLQSLQSDLDKRKNNFMNKCVSKMRSLIKKEK
ncbi:uncharacterized protein LOC128668986 [Microplitis demolitor]|uniref:uncharacterized protein LOC128668986 n=1 Tax=Microplitis demolitor TaxID=69319 RepID=UPI00235B6DEB|nr:uncharacterized protein LOC128668986 [Microplitis demolitor]